MDGATAAEIAGYAEQLNQRFVQFIAHALQDVEDLREDEPQIHEFFYADDEKLIEACRMYWDEHKTQIDGPIVAEYATVEEREAAGA